MKFRGEYLQRAIDDFNTIVASLTAKGNTRVPFEVAEQRAQSMLIAARLESLEDAISEGLPTAGEGI